MRSADDLVLLGLCFFFTHLTATAGFLLDNGLTTPTIGTLCPHGFENSQG